MKLSIIITNYNYAKFVGAAIDSALAVDWPDKEVIVADDGSTDDSREVIVGYGSKIVPILLSNGGLTSACNAGFDRSTGDIIIFLDSDDILFPSAARTAIEAWYPRVSKVQYSLAVVDETLTPLGTCLPAYRQEFTPEWARRMLKKTGSYPFSFAGAWSRRILAAAFPLPVRQGAALPNSGCNGDWSVPFPDHYLSHLAPFFGDVVAIDDHKPQGLYRLHGRNAIALSKTSLEGYANSNVERLACARAVNELLARLNINEEINVEFNEIYMRNKLISQRFGITCPDRGTLLQILFKYWRSVYLDEAPLRSKAKWYLWSFLVTASPRPISLWAVCQRDKRQMMTLRGTK
jgi:glycosyltransferase involved in cell wall biosynthesis